MSTATPATRPAMMECTITVWGRDGYRTPELLRETIQLPNGDYGAAYDALLDRVRAVRLSGKLVDSAHYGCTGWNQNLNTRWVSTFPEWH